MAFAFRGTSLHSMRTYLFECLECDVFFNGMCTFEKVQHGSYVAAGGEDQILLCLFPAAAERVHDAGTFEPVALERGDHRRMGTTHVQQHRQRELRGQRQLRFEQLLLALDVRIVDVVIQADLTDGAELRLAAQALQPVAQLLDMGVLMFVEEHRMQAQRRVYRWLVTGQLPNPLPVGGMHAEYHDALDADSLAAGDHRGAVLIERIEIEMGVGVDQLHEQTPYGRR